MLLTVDDWERVCARPVLPRVGRPIVGVDLGGGRAWSAAVALWRSGRVEAIAVAPGIPGLEEQEKRDRVPPGLYRKLAQSGALSVAEGLRVQPPAELMRGILGRWGAPEVVICDRFRLNELRDCRGRVRAAHVPPAPPAEVGRVRAGLGTGGTGGGDDTFFLLKRVNSAYEPASQNAFGHLRTTYVVRRASCCGKPSAMRWRVGSWVIS